MIVYGGKKYEEVAVSEGFSCVGCYFFTDEEDPPCPVDSDGFLLCGEGNVPVIFKEIKE